MERAPRIDGTEKALRKHLMDFAKRLQKRPAEPEPSEPTVRQLCKSFLQDKQEKVKQSTCSTYTTIIEKHILPNMGELRVGELTMESVRELLRKSAEGDSEEPLASSTMRGIITVMRGMLSYAEQRGWSVPPASAFQRPPKKAAEVRVLSEEEQKRLRECCQQDMDCEKLGILICMYTGLRLGEVCALKWGDISLESGTLRVKRTIQRIRSAENRRDKGIRTQVIFDAPKSRSSNRCIALPGFLVEILKPFSRGGDCFVLTGVTGSFLEPRTYQNHYKKLLKQARVEYVNFHALRHTFATNCVNLGFDPKTLSEILGHADVSVTLNTYVHPSLSRMKQYMERLN